MAQASDTWTVHPHGELEELAENLWHVTGAVPGMSLKRAMTLAKLRDGRVIVHNAISLDEPQMAEIDAWGPVSFIIVPNGLHRIDGPAWKKRYPKAQLLAARGSRKKVEERVKVDLVYEEFEGDDSVGLQTLDGVKNAEGALTVRSSDGTTVVLNDAVFNMELPAAFFPRLMLSIMGSAPGPRVSRLAKLLLISDREALRANLIRFASLPDLARLIVSHDKIARGQDARDALERAITFL